MNIFKIGQINDLYLESVGGKARGLDKLAKAGFTVPKGFVLININNETDLEEAYQYFLKSKLKNVAVRSSATAEDGENFSFAGQFLTFLNVTAKDFKDSVHKCLESLNNYQSISYAKTFVKNQENKMSVVVQEMIDADYAGVCFTINPTNNNHLLIEAVKGLGESLVSGLSSATQYSLPHNKDFLKTKDFLNIVQNQKLLSPTLVSELIIKALEMQSLWNAPLDIEWAIKNNKIYWLQSRPITVSEDYQEEEFDIKENLDGNVVTRCNIGEMLPGATTPLTQSVSLYAIDWGMREMLRVAGAIKKVNDLPPYACAFANKGHLFLNLSTIYRLSNAVFLADEANINFSICGRDLEEKGKSQGKKLSKIKKLINTYKYLRFIFSRNKARKQLVKIVNKFKIYRGGETIEELYIKLSYFQTTANKVAYLHYITSAHSGAMSAATLKELQKKETNMDQCKIILTELLARINDIESVDILASLRNIAQAILLENPKAKNFDQEELKNYLDIAGDSVKDKCDYFFKRHGHRAIREAELRSKGWADDKDAFVRYLKSVIASDIKTEENQQTPNFKQILANYGFKKSAIKKIIYFTKQSRESVKNREFSKAKLVKVLDEFKKAYRQLSTMLVELNRLPDEDAIFFLSHKEIGMLVEKENQTLVRKAVQRRRLLKEQSNLSFKEVYVGKPVPLDAVSVGEIRKKQTGTPISRGVATGAARVIHSAEDAAKLQKGEIMVAVYTDIGWSPFYSLIDGLVTEIGSALSHGAVVAREYAIPFVSNVSNATKTIKTGDLISVNGLTGEVVILDNKNFSS